MKRFLKILALFLGIVLLSGLILPFIFKDRIVNELKKALNKDIKGQVEFKDASLSIFKNFPKLTLSVEEPRCKSFVYQDTSLLFQATEIQLGFNLWTIISNKENLIISKVVFLKPLINVIQYDSLTMNYNIFESSPKDSSQSSSALAFDIQSFKISEGSIQYESKVSGILLGLNQINHEGSFSSSNELTRILTKTVIKEINYQKNEIFLLKKAIFISNLNLDYLKQDHLLSFSKGEFNLNNLKLECKGTLGSKGDSIILDLDLKAPNNQFKDLFSILPNAVIKDFAQVKSEGKFQMEAKLNGVYNDKQNIFPSWKFLCNVENGFLKYPEKSIQLENFKLDIVSQNTGPSIRNSYFVIKDFSFLLNKQSFSGNLQLSNLIDDLSVKGMIKGVLNLTDLNNFYPVPDNTKVSGSIKPNVSFHFSKSAIVKRQYDQIDFTGNLVMSDINYNVKGQPNIEVKSGEIKLNSKQLEVNDLVLRFGQSDMLVQGLLNEPLNFITEDEKVSGKFNATSKVLNLKEWTVEDATKPKVLKIQSSKGVPDYITKLDLDINCAISQMIFSDYDIRDTKASGFIQGNTIKINQFASLINRNQLNGFGTIVGVYSYIMEDKVLNGNLTISSKQFDADQFMAKSNVSNSNTSNGTEGSVPFVVPQNFNISIRFVADEVIYKPLKLNKALGSLVIVNNEIQFEDLSANLSGGKISLKGLYNTEDPNKPYFNMKFDMLKLPFSDAVSSFVSIKKLAPIMQYIQGSFNTNLIMEGFLDKNMFPIYENLNIAGLFETLEGSIKGFKPLDVLADKLNLVGLKNLNISGTKNWVTVKNGSIAIKDFNKKVEDIDLNINGKHNISGIMDYQLVIKIPKNKVAKFTSALKLDHALDQLNSVLSKMNMGGSVLKNLNLLVNMTGTMSNPSFGFKLLNDKGETTDVQDELKESIKTKVTDSIKSRIESEKEKATAEFNKMQDSISKQATKKAEEVKNQVLDKASKEVLKTVDSNIVNKAKESVDSLSQKILNKDVRKEADQIKDKLKDWNPFKKDKK